ncbi:MAG: hypothetical protein HQK56_11390, partial [Deltaproteobacteria bacterium]|nr:hypothetical protein [Deltaproteobacteria bacterium]
MGWVQMIQRLGGWVLVLILLSGCSMGPRVLKGNRAMFNVSIQQSNNEQMMINLLRVRYLEAPLFLRIGAVSAAFNYEAAVGGSMQIPEHTYLPATMANIITPNLALRYNEAPTITYTPLEGEQYTTQVLSEISLDRFALLCRSGWSVGYLMSVVMERIGDLDNFPMRAGQVNRVAGSNDRFAELSRILGEMQNRGDMDIVSVMG